MLQRPGLPGHIFYIRKSPRPLLDLMYAKAPYTVLKRAMHIHPTVSELLPTMMGQLRPLQ